MLNVGTVEEKGRRGGNGGVDTYKPILGGVGRLLMHLVLGSLWT
jgi:hypothetical protein